VASDPDFARTMSGIAANEVIIPRIHTQLFNTSFSGFAVVIPSWDDDKRIYDGWFHPSAHSTWTVRQLYAYLTRHQTLQEERMELTSIMAVTRGKFWHMFLQRIMLDDGVLIEDEVPIEDAETNRRGHADGLLSTGELLEIKTINRFKVSKINSEEALRELKPQYWAQTQDYLDCLGVDAMRYLMINPDWPFEMSEFVVRANELHQARRRKEYLQAIEMALAYPTGEALAADSELALCCAPGSKAAKQCPAALACPIGGL
jgi:hypothetical protein